MSKKKKILYIHHAGGLGGAPISLSFLLDRIDRSKIEAKLLCIFRGEVISFFKSKNTDPIVEERIYPFHGSTVSGMYLKIFLVNFLRLPQSIWYGYKTIKSIRPDIVHLNSSSLCMLGLAAKLVNKNIKVICHIREPLLQHSLCASIIRYVNYLFVDQFVAIDNYSASTTKSKSDVKVIYNAVDFHQFNTGIQSTLVRTKLGLQKEDVLFLFLARISKSNGVLEMLSVIEKLVVKYNNFHFLIAGFRDVEPDAKYVEKVNNRMAQLKNVHKWPFTKDVPPLIANVDVMLVPFTEPHFARSIIEASAMGVPSIGNRIGGVEELIISGETGFLYDSLNDFFLCCEQLGTDTILRSKMSQKAEQFARTNFDHQINAEKIFNLY